MAIAPHGSFLGSLGRRYPLGLEHFGSGEDVITPECDGLKLANAFLVPFWGVQGKAVSEPVAGACYDLWSRRSIHRAYIWSGLLLICSQPLRLATAGPTPGWAFARFLVT